MSEGTGTQISSTCGGGAEQNAGILDVLRFGVLSMFNTREANTLRLVSKGFLSDVADHPWRDMQTVIQGYVGDQVGVRQGQRGAWRACFPRAKYANITRGGTGFRRNSIIDSDFVHLAGLEQLNMNYCTEITDAAFVHLVGIQKLSMYACINITDAAFVHLVGIKELNITCCYQITDNGIQYIRGVRMLNMAHCYKITGAAFQYLNRVQELSISGHNNPTIRDSDFTNLKELEVLDMSSCQRCRITKQVFEYIWRLKMLNIYQTNQITDEDCEDLKIRFYRNPVEWSNLFKTSFISF